VLGALWNRLVGHRNADAVERIVEMQRMSPAERLFAEESFEDKQAASGAEEWFGDLDPERLLDGEEHPRGRGE
jgi:hypothetical protein